MSWHSPLAKKRPAVKARRRPVRRRGLGAIALATAGLLALLCVAAGALHQHATDSGAAQIDCRACAWSHAAAAGLHHAPPLLVALDVSAIASPADSADVPHPSLTKWTIRGPPALSL